jgi:hypothetical protein
MNDDQSDGLNASAYWRDRAEKESREKRAEAKARVGELRAWWSQMDRWAEFTKSYPLRLAIMAMIASRYDGVSQARGVFTFPMPQGPDRDFTMDAPRYPSWEFKEDFEACERYFEMLSQTPNVISFKKRAPKRPKPT